MTIGAWIRAGWGFMVVAGLLGALSAALVFSSVRDGAVIVQPLRAAFTTPQVIQLGRFLSGLVSAVLAGAAFFSGLACFFWASARQRHELLEEILRKLPDQP
ncbi:hypothetical protein [Actinomadura rupiterrae]|uniref:hypothetical protein n=1 Tax=Actinomadura rupiterrae TaxID=559627 RepID=UPI0020A5F3E9|nr:hypothetical protein [Actinomadura rupiterrae]MCP2341216.1 hypothetical protein [Actinomadura rupiterrae]